jgi:hypothetical protein
MQGHENLSKAFGAPQAGSVNQTGTSEAVEMGHPAYSPVQIPPGFMETRVSVALPLVSSTILGSIPVAPLNNRLQMLAAPKETVARPGRFVELYVEDQGAGIPSYLLDRIFEPFFTTRER